MVVMVPSSQAQHSLVMSVSSDQGIFRRNLSSQLVSSSCSPPPNISTPYISFSNSNGHSHALRQKDLWICGHGDCQNRKSVSPGTGRRVGTSNLLLKDDARTKAYWKGSKVYQVEFTFPRLSDPDRRHGFSSLRCSAADEMASVENNTDTCIELPLFPLPLVLFPGAILPLQIFEFRYRIMMHTLLQTDLRFGVVYTDKASGLAAVGCVGEVVKHERLVDDRFFMICKGQERFRVRDIVRTKPYLVARVEWLEDRPSDEQEDVEALANEVETYMKDVIRLSNRVNGKPEKVAPEDLRKKLFPTPFSFWVASTFEGAPVEQQALLELEDTAQRLKREKETLRNTLNYLSAASAVKDAFPSTE